MTPTEFGGIRSHADMGWMIVCYSFMYMHLPHCTRYHQVLWNRFWGRKGSTGLTSGKTFLGPWNTVIHLWNVQKRLLPSPLAFRSQESPSGTWAKEYLQIAWTFLMKHVILGYPLLRQVDDLYPHFGIEQSKPVLKSQIQVYTFWFHPPIYYIVNIDNIREVEIVNQFMPQFGFLLSTPIWQWPNHPPQRRREGLHCGSGWDHSDFDILQTLNLKVTTGTGKSSWNSDCVRNKSFYESSDAKLKGYSLKVRYPLKPKLTSNWSIYINLSLRAHTQVLIPIRALHFTDFEQPQARHILQSCHNISWGYGLRKFLDHFLNGPNKTI